MYVENFRLHYALHLPPPKKEYIGSLNFGIAYTSYFPFLSYHSILFGFSVLVLVNDDIQILSSSLFRSSFFIHELIIFKVYSFHWKIVVGKWVKLVEVSWNWYFFVEVDWSRLKWVEVDILLYNGWKLVKIVD